MKPSIKSGNIQQFVRNMKAISDEFRKAYPEVVKRNAINTAELLLKHSYPAPGNDLTKGQGGTEEAREQGEQNLASDISKMFVPLDRFSVKDLVLAKNDVVFNLNNPIDWQSKDMERAWESQNLNGLYEAFARNDTGSSLDEYPNLSEMVYQDEPTVEAQMTMMTPKHQYNGKGPIAVKDAAAIRNFLIQRFQSIGKSANGWRDCINKLGGMADSALPGTGIGRVTHQKDELTIINEYGDPNGMISESGILDEVMQWAGDDFVQDVQKVTDDLLKRHQTK